MGSVNRVHLIGNLGRDPEIRYTKASQAVASFSIATTETWKDKDGTKQEKTEWHRIVAWGKLGEICGEYLTKGKQVYIEGRLQTREWDDKDGNKRSTTEIVASTMTMLGQAGGQSSGAVDQGRTNCQCPKCNKTPCICEDNFEDGDIPF